MGTRKKLNPERRKAKLKEWERHARKLRRGKIIVPWDEIPDPDVETVAFERVSIQEVLNLLRNHSVTFWTLGPLDNLCGTIDHEAE